MKQFDRAQRRARRTFYWPQYSVDHHWRGELDYHRRKMEARVRRQK